MNKTLTCIVCPIGCEITAELGGNGEILSVEGATCKRGVEYLKTELTDPRRNIASLVLVENGELPLASVRLTDSVPLDKIFDVMEAIKKVKVKAPVTQGQIVIENVLGLNSNVIVTKNIKGV